MLSRRAWESRSCTSIIDAIDGAARHVVQRISFAVVAKAPIEKFGEHGERRGGRYADGGTDARDARASRKSEIRVAGR